MNRMRGTIYSDEIFFFFLCVHTKHFLKPNQKFYGKHQKNSSNGMDIVLEIG